MREQYQQYLESPHWKKTRARKRNRAKQCGICGATERLDVHHLNYRNLIDVEMSDLRVLCRHCHEVAHQLHREGAYQFTSTNHHHRWAILKSAVKRHLSREVVTVESGPCITAAWLRQCSSPAGGWTRRQLAALGISWPPPKGWKRSLIGRPLSDDVRHEVERRSR